MAFNNNGNGNNKVFEPNYYAKTYYTNYEAERALNITYGAGLMKLTIATRPKDNSTERTDLITTALTGLKAQLLVNAMEQMESDIATGEAEGKSYGTSTGMGDVVKAIAFTVVDGKKQLVMAKVDSTGNISDKTVYEFAQDTNYYMTWDDFDRMKFAKQFDNQIEYNMLKNTLIDFARNISGAAGYGTLYLDRYERNRDHGKVNQIMDKLGINVAKGNGGFQRSENNYFNNNAGSGNKSSEHKSFADIESMLNLEDDDE